MIADGEKQQDAESTSSANVWIANSPLSLMRSFTDSTSPTSSTTAEMFSRLK